jgi:hypothetical protein
MSKVKSTYSVCTKCIILYCVCTLYVLLLCGVHTLYVHRLYIVRTGFVLCTYKLHHFQNSLKAVCTEYILCSSVHSTESIPAAYSKSIKAFIPIITLSVLHPCPLQEGLLLAAAGGSAGRASAPALASAAARPRRLRWPPLQRSTLLPNRRSVGMTSPTVLTIHRAEMDLSWSRMWHDVLW